jgi:hypothetical protein
MFCVGPVSANYNTSGTVTYSYGISSSYATEGTGADASLHLTHLEHRFTDAQFITGITITHCFQSTLSYTKSNITTFTANVDGQYYGNGLISVTELPSGDIEWFIDFYQVNESYASTLTGTKGLVLVYDSNVWHGVIPKSGTSRYYPNVINTNSSQPTVMCLLDHPPSMFCWIGDNTPNILSAYSMVYENTYNYNFNSSYNISTLSIERSSDASLWHVYDSVDYIYFEDQSGYSTTGISQDFFRQSGVYANTTFDTGGGPVSIYTIIDINGTDVPPDDEDYYIFEYNITTELDEYSPGDTVNVTYTTDQKGTIQVVKTISGDIYHSIGFVSGATNATWDFYIAENEPYGFYDIYLLDSSNTILDSVRYSLLPTTSSLDILQSSVDLHETFVVFAQTVNESILSIEDPDGVEVWNESIGALMYDYIYYTPTIKTGIYTAYLYDDSTLNDTVMVYLADPPIIDDPLDPIVIEDVLEDDESMTEYFDDKFREFAPTAWGIFLLSIILWLMAILTSFGGSSKRR